MPYEKPEQPPADTYTRSALSGLASFFKSCLSWVTAVSVMVSIVSASERESDQFYQDFAFTGKIGRLDPDRAPVQCLRVPAWTDTTRSTPRCRLAAPSIAPVSSPTCTTRTRHT